VVQTVTPQLYISYLEDRLKEAKEQVLKTMEDYAQYQNKVMTMSLLGRLGYRIFNKPVKMSELIAVGQQAILVERSLETARLLQHDVKLKSESEDFEKWFHSRYPEQRKTQ
jgi:hypothetical protein